ncbi:MAG: tetratricopeptide repeat protein [Elusimicrobiota bacterium]|nr:tetratricopeptide repeat protein [Elusimicrobiota bacterium]
MKKLMLFTLIFSLAFCAARAQQTGRPQRETGKEAGMMLDLQKISLGTISSVEQKKQYLSTVQLEKQRIQNYTLRMVYENAYALYRRGDYQRAQELANVILSIDPSLSKAQTLASEAGRMAVYGTVSEQEIINMKYEEGRNLYKMGRLVEAQAKFEEILVLRPYEPDAQNWVKRIDDEIAQQHTRRGFYAYKNGDYQEALNQWYSVLLIKKDDKDLINKISEIENTMKTEENRKLVAGAFSLYNEGKLVPAYREFEKALEVQPGEQQTQKYAMQLKGEIAGGYYTAGNKAYGVKQYDKAINNWKEAKNWGYNQNDINTLVKNAEKAKAAALLARKKPADKPATEEEDPTPAPVVTVEPLLGGGGAAPVQVGPDGQPITVDQGETPIGKMIDKQGTISEDARQASIERYRIGISYYNQANFDKAKEEWQAALQLNPENSDAALGLKRIEAQYGAR